MISSDLIGQVGRPRALACPVCRTADGSCLGHDPLSKPTVNIGDSPILEDSPMTAADNAPDPKANVPSGGKVGVKTDEDVNAQVAADAAGPAGPIGRFVRQPVREGIKAGYRGEDEGIIDVIEPGTNEQTKAANAQRVAGEDPAARVSARSARVVEPDYLKDERPAYPSADAGDAPDKRTKAVARAEADAIGVEGLTARSTLDEIESAIADHKAAQPA